MNLQDQEINISNQLRSYSLELESLESRMSKIEIGQGYVYDPVGRLLIHNKTWNDFTLNLESDLMDIYQDASQLSFCPDYYKSELIRDLQIEFLRLESKIAKKKDWLEKEEKKIKEFFEFTKEYAATFQISQEDLFNAHSHELHHALYDYEFLLQSKEELGQFSASLDSVRTYVKQEINSLSLTKTGPHSRDLFRAIIAFATKNLDDSHISGLPFLLILLRGTEMDFYGETNNKETLIQNSKRRQSCIVV